MFFWAVLICCVVIGSLLPAASPAIVALGRLHLNDKVMHFCAYLALSLLPVAGFRDRRRGLMAGLSMFLLGVLMEAGQHFSPGRAVELGDVVANGVGVSCGALLGPHPLADRHSLSRAQFPPARPDPPANPIFLGCDPPGRRPVRMREGAHTFSPDRY